MMLIVLQLSVMWCFFFKYCSIHKRGSNSPEPLADEINNSSNHVANKNSSETSKFYDMTNYMPVQDRNYANKNKEYENVCPLSFKLKDFFFNSNHL